ncbi:MAG: ureidoglycolate lyase, partial [Geminicoccaceae bacterium]
AQLLVVRYVHEPFACHLLERHLSVTQAFVPLGEHPSVMVAAPPTDLDEPDRVPRPDEVRAFYVPGSCGLMLWRGTWHALTRFPVRSEGASFLMVTGADTQRELEREKADGTRPRLTQVVDYGERADLRFSIVDPDGLLLHSLEHLVT